MSRVRGLGIISGDPEGHPRGSQGVTPGSKGLGALGVGVLGVTSEDWARYACPGRA